jgi:hypothetical protein
MSIIGKTVEYLHYTGKDELETLTGKVVDKYRGFKILYTDTMVLDLYLIKNSTGALHHVNPTDIRKVLAF